MSITPHSRLFGEALGTFVIVFFGTGAAMLNAAYPSAVGHVGISLAFGVSVALSIWTFSPLSGGHFNPVVSWVFYALGTINRSALITACLAQVLGAFLASFTLSMIFPGFEALGLTRPAVGVPEAFWIEALLTFLLVFTVLSMVYIGRCSLVLIGAGVGGLIFLEALVAGPLTGASMNPTRSIGPALVAGHFTHLWVYVAAPFSGGLMAWLGFRLMTKERCACLPRGSREIEV
ncbi:MAG TPA: MIP/aquaporin family protein [Luteibaculaceae bacterium]|nr:MIP/aquaporin family protein [Luteibaculaceae bacterium]